MADIRLGYGVSERQQAPSSANYSRAVDVGPAAAEGRPAKRESIAWRISARRSRTASGAGDRPSTFTEPPTQPSTASW